MQKQSKWGEDNDLLVIVKMTCIQSYKYKWDELSLEIGKVKYFQNSYISIDLIHVTRLNYC